MPDLPGRGRRYRVERAGGVFAKSVSDEQIIEAWLEEPSTRKVARKVDLSERQIRQRLAKLRADGRLPHADPDLNREGKIAQLGASVPTNVQGAQLKELSVALWGVAAKNADGELVKQGLDGLRAKYSFSGKEALVIPPRPSKIVAYRANLKPTNTAQRIFIVGDMQLGFWAVRDPKNPQKIRFVPFHDERAVDVMLQAIGLYRPNRLVIIGDFFDFPMLSRFQQEPEFAQTLQATIQEGYDLLRKIRKTAGDKCKMDFIPGNHETRMQRAITNNLPQLFNLTRPGESWPVYSVPSLMKFDELKITCAAEYPSGEVWLAKRHGLIPGLVATHADPKKKDLRADAIHGHLVLPSLEMRQVFYEDGPTTYTRMCVSGCANYSDTGDKVRVTRTNTPSGRSRMGAVQSFGTIDLHTSGLRKFGLHLIHDGRVMFGDQLISTRIRRGQ